jgi:hypothetical protein
MAISPWEDMKKDLVGQEDFDPGLAAGRVLSFLKMGLVC